MVTSIKSWWAEIKAQFMGVMIAIFFGFCIGKIYTWDTIITDCKVLGTFRIATTAFACKMLVP